jgi:ATP-dependent RNA helicase RhlE
MSFSSLGLSAELLRAVSDQGYDAPTPIQAQAIPVVLEGRDLMATAQTGTGKTAAFTLPLLQKLSTGPKGRVRALVLTPTRELAQQVSDSVRTYGRHLQLRSAEVYGGVNINPQMKQLRAGVDVLVATPGRLIDHLQRRTADLSSVQILVLDEADRMLDMGFLPAIERIIKQLPHKRQTLLFSATFSDPIRTLAQKFLISPQMIDIARRNATAEAISQSAYMVDADRKRDLLMHLFESQSWQQVLVFTRTKHGADRLAKQLDKGGIQAVAIHGDKSQGARNRALADFKRMKVRALVATDVAARGLDIDELPHVVNFDLPHNPEDYVHRIGRTGRGGKQGAAISLVSSEERSQYRAIKRLVQSEIITSTEPGFEPQRSADVERPAGNGARPNRSGSPSNRPHRGGSGDERRRGHRDARQAHGHGDAARAERQGNRPAGSPRDAHSTRRGNDDRTARSGAVRDNANAKFPSDSNRSYGENRQNTSVRSSNGSERRGGRWNSDQRSASRSPGAARPDRGNGNAGGPKRRAVRERAYIG